MQTTTTLLLAALTGSALAQNWRAHPALKRDLEHIQARATDSAMSDLDLSDITPECQSAVFDIIGTIPTPAPKIAAEEMKNPQTADPCSFSTPSSLKSEYAAYSSEVMSWYSDHESQIMNAFSACSDIADKASDFVAICSTDIPMSMASKASSDAKETGSATDSSSEAEETGDKKDDEDSAAGRLAVGGLAVVAAAAAALL